MFLLGLLFEIEHLGTLSELMDNIEGLIRASVSSAMVHVKNEDHLDYLSEVLSKPFARITYTEAVGRLKDSFPNLEWGDDFTAIHEKQLTDIFGPVLVREYPEHIKFFSMINNEVDPKVVDSCDLLLPFAGESAGAAQRVTNYDDLVKKLKKSEMYKMMKSQGVEDAEFEWYLNHHKDNSIDSHSGAGIGMARVAQFILGEEDIRNAVPFVVNSENLI